MTKGRPEIHATVLRIIREQTLYGEAELGLDADLEGELGIDSVLLEAVLADLRDVFALPDAAFRRARYGTLRELIGAVGELLPAARDPRDAIAEAVMSIVRAQTLYEDDALDTAADLEGELGIDSVILLSVLADIESRVGLPDGALAGRGFGTIDQIIDATIELARSRGISGADLASPAPPPAGSAESSQASAEASTTPATPSAKAAMPSAKAAMPSAEAVTAPAPMPSTDDIERLPAAPVKATMRLPGLDETPTDTADLRRLVERITGRSLDGLQDDRPLHLAGVDGADRSQLFETLGTHLGRQAIRLEDCDTLEKLQRYLQAAGPHALEALSPPDPDRPAAAKPRWDGRTMKDFVEVRGKDLFAKAHAFGAFYRQQQRDSLYWYGMPSESPCRNRIVIYDEVAGRRREFLNFASNNYIGLANHPRVIEAIGAATRQYGATNTGCRIIGGTTALHKELERRLAAFKQRPACIVYPGGYSANLGCISALVKRHDAVIVDKYNHMSIVDGCNLSGGQRKIYQHDDMHDLERVLERTAPKVDGMLIATDGVFSMHGNICNLPRIVELARQYGARVLVDDAHSTGVLGKTGAGTAEHFGLKGQVDLELGTMSKSLAGLGGFVVGEEEVIDYLRFYSNSYVFAATIPAGVAAGLIASIDVLEQEPERVQRLWQNIRYLSGHLAAAGFDLGGAESAIVPIVIGDDEKTLLMGREVRAAGLFCQTVVYPGVSVGDARLRISVTSEHTREDLDLAVSIFVDAARKVGVLPMAEV